MTTSAVWQNYSSDLKRFIFNILKDEQAANDVLQEVFIKVHLKLHTVIDAGKLKPWLFAIAKNQTLDYLSKQTKHTEIQSLEFEEVAPEPKEHNAKDCLLGILKSLPEKYRNPITLYDVKGKKQQAIANELQLPLPTVKSLIQRARKMVIKGYMDCCDFTLNKHGKLVGEIKEKQFCKVCNG